MASLHGDPEGDAGQDVRGMVLVVGDARGADEEGGAERHRLRQEHRHAASYRWFLEAGLMEIHSWSKI